MRDPLRHHRAHQSDNVFGDSLAERAWLAGLFEGEGNISITRAGYVSISIGMNDLDVIQRVQAIFPSPSPIWVRPPRLDTHNTHYIWRLTRAELACNFLELVMPFLGERRYRRANEALKAMAGRPGLGHKRNVTHCPAGHPYEGDNLVIEKNGHRACRECRRASSREYQRRRTGFYERAGIRV